MTVPYDTGRSPSEIAVSVRPIVHSDGEIFLRGMAMGAADLVPGVSGGTIALISGIYLRLIQAIAQCDVTAIGLLMGRQWGAFWHRIDGRFLLVLVAGIGFAVVLLARLIRDLLLTQSLPLWSFFFGLVLASVLILKSGARGSWYNPILAGLACLLAGSLALMPPSDVLSGYSGLFCGGAIAICAMILPGISGSFLLLLLGLYPTVITAISEFDVAILGVFAAGCVAGLTTFSRLLNWVLIQYYDQTLSVLRGFLLGSLLALWPWQHTLVSLLDSHGNERVLQRQPVLPQVFAADGGDPQVLMCAIAALSGASIVLLMNRWQSRQAAL